MVSQSAFYFVACELNTVTGNRQHRKSISQFVHSGRPNGTKTGSIIAILVESGILYCCIWVGIVLGNPLMLYDVLTSKNFTLLRVLRSYTSLVRWPNSIPEPPMSGPMLCQAF